MPKKIEAYRCDFCRRVSATKSGITTHENACKNNPEACACTTCGNFRLVDYDFSCHEEESPFWDDSSMSYDELMKDPNIDHIGGFQKYCQSWIERNDKYGDDAHHMTDIKGWAYPIAFYFDTAKPPKPFDSDDGAPF